MPPSLGGEAGTVLEMEKRRAARWWCTTVRIPAHQGQARRATPYRTAPPPFNGTQVPPVDSGTLRPREQYTPATGRWAE
jgi:hypothetical protein